VTGQESETGDGPSGGNASSSENGSRCGNGVSCVEGSTGDRGEVEECAGEGRVEREECGSQSEALSGDVGGIGIIVIDILLGDDLVV